MNKLEELKKEFDSLDMYDGNIVHDFIDKAYLAGLDKAKELLGEDKELINAITNMCQVFDSHNSVQHEMTDFDKETRIELGKQLGKLYEARSLILSRIEDYKKEIK